MALSRRVTSNILGVLGAVVGGALGYYTFGLIYHYRFYGMMIPGALLGLGCGLLARHPSQIRGVLCGVAGLVLGLYTEWSFFPFLADDSLDYFLKHLTSLNAVSIGMILAGAFFAYWLGKDGGYRSLRVSGRDKVADFARNDTSAPN
jgi:hypothetical protein